MAGISFIDVDLGDAAKTIVPVLALTAGAAGLYWLYTQVQNNQANAQASAAPGSAATALYQQAEDAALLQSLFPGTQTPAQNTSTSANTTATANQSTNPAVVATSAAPSGGNLNAPAQGSGVA